MCIDCETSKLYIWHAFTGGCKGCEARALSRGPDYWESAKQKRQSPSYMQQIQRLGLTHQQVKQAHQEDALNRRTP